MSASKLPPMASGVQSAPASAAIDQQRRAMPQLPQSNPPLRGAIGSMADGIVAAGRIAGAPASMASLPVVATVAPVRVVGLEPVALPRRAADLGLTDAQIMATVELSPTDVAQHLKEAWINLYLAEGLRFSDPLGSGFYTRAQLSAFWDAFIKNNNVHFEIKQDARCGNEVFRDVFVHIERDGKSYAVPAYLMYKIDVREVDGRREPVVAQMLASWSLGGAMIDAIVHPSRWGVMLKSFGDMFKSLGFLGTMRHLGGLFAGIGASGTKEAKKLIKAINAHDAAGIQARFTQVGDRGNVAQRIYFPAIEMSRRMGCEELATRLQAEGWQLRLLPKDSVELPGVHSKGIVSAGWYTTFGYELSRNHEVIRGVARCIFDPRSRDMISADFFQASRGELQLTAP